MASAEAFMWVRWVIATIIGLEVGCLSILLVPPTPLADPHYRVPPQSFPERGDGFSEARLAREYPRQLTGGGITGLGPYARELVDAEGSEAFLRDLLRSPRSMEVDSEFACRLARWPWLRVRDYAFVLLCLKYGEGAGIELEMTHAQRDRRIEQWLEAHPRPERDDE